MTVQDPMPPRWTTRLAAIALAPAHLVERTRGRKRLALLLVYAVIVTLGVVLVWWSQSLRNLPDIGDPFDVAASRAEPVADADNAFRLYREAHAKKVPLKIPTQIMISKFLGTVQPWSAAPPELAEHLENSREAMLLWKRGTDRPNLQVVVAEGPAGAEAFAILNDVRHTFPWLAMLEASRLRQNGELAEAWSWYRAVLNAHRNTAASELLTRYPMIHHELPAHMQAWAADPRVDVGLLRQALAEAVAIDAQVPDFATSLKHEYLRAMKELDAPRSPIDYGRVTEDEWYKHLPMYGEAIVFLKREPEQSRRVLRLIYANLLAHVDDPLARWPQMIIPPGVFDHPLDPSMSDPAGRISPDALAVWLGTTLFAKHMNESATLAGWINTEQRTRANILLDLARALYEREHGKPPKTDADLVGTYLERLPKGAIDPENP